ncbi:MAG: 50S ribosomal protein L17 [Bacteroidetes bacterium]|nr:50S ribosomal protein L17 [Bacteroidota bacterium]MBU1116079.1 50S ribosomal protein L17 [Bacteroidota bacterium]MBU1799153.1 50S ribosomal protein L17 [Bacteroidota bacterium]
MRHRVRGRKLNRTASHRLATFRALATALFREKKIRTTISKAKELRGFAEPLISRAKEDTVANRRQVAKHIQDKDVLKELFSEIIPKVGNRPGGYTRIVKLGQRRGDAAEMAIIELVDYNDVNAKENAPKIKVKKEDIQDANVVEETVSTEVVTSEDTESVKTDVENVAEEEVKAEETITEVKTEDK